uniref:Uncharacterized protein n=1 Tax=Ixodes ricinus TaxID=34613 RepID=A0A6B0V2F1_IXORI
MLRGASLQLRVCSRAATAVCVYHRVRAGPSHHEGVRVRERDDWSGADSRPTQSQEPRKWSGTGIAWHSSRALFPLCPYPHLQGLVPKDTKSPLGIGALVPGPVLGLLPALLGGAEPLHQGPVPRRRQGELPAAGLHPDRLRHHAAGQHLHVSGLLRLPTLLAQHLRRGHALRRPPLLPGLVEQYHVRGLLQVVESCRS